MSGGMDRDPMDRPDRKRRAPESELIQAARALETANAEYLAACAAKAVVEDRIAKAMCARNEASERLRDLAGDL